MYCACLWRCSPDPCSGHSWRGGPEWVLMIEKRDEYSMVRVEEEARGREGKGKEEG